MSGPGPESAPPPPPQSPPPGSPPGPPPGPPPTGTPSGLPSWTSNITSTAQVAGPAGLFYADVPNRIIAYIIDAILLGIVNIVVSIVLFSILGSPTTVREVADPNSILGFRFETQTNYVSTLIYAVVGTAISAGYFIYTWTAMRGTVGMKLLGMQIGHEADGRTLTYNQAAIRWVLLGAPFGLAQLLSGWPGLGLLIGLLGLGWLIALLVTTAQSPTKQGLHDKYAHTMVVKAARAVS